MRAILSVSDKTGLIPFARGLADRGVQLVSTGGTAKAIAEAGLPVTNVSEVTGFPEMMDGRVKTLHPKIHGGILARRHRADDLEAIASQGVELVDLVVVNLYPFARAAQNPETPFDELDRSTSAGRRSCARPARISATSSSSSIRRTIRACSSRWRGRTGHRFRSSSN
jgi:phosphoribosylaminoimidazolecarboxamide formyltransferase / IMP cyclohydrolase